MRRAPARRRLLLAVAAVALVLAAGVVLLWPRSPVRRENGAKVEPGMSLDQVEAILGGPPGVYGGRPDLPLRPTGSRLIVGQQWFGPEVVITVAFGLDGRVQAVQIRDVDRP